MGSSIRTVNMLRADMSCEPLPQPEGNVLVLHELRYPGDLAKGPYSGSTVDLTSHIDDGLLARLVVEKIANSAELSRALAEAIAEELATVLIERGVLLVTSSDKAPPMETAGILTSGIKALLSRLELREMGAEREEPDE